MLAEVDVYLYLCLLLFYLFANNLHSRNFSCIALVKIKKHAKYAT